MPVVSDGGATLGGGLVELGEVDVVLQGGGGQHVRHGWLSGLSEGQVLRPDV